MLSDVIASAKPSLLAYRKYGCRWRVRPNFTHLSYLNTSVWAFIRCICALVCDKQRALHHIFNNSISEIMNVNKLNGLYQCVSLIKHRWKWPVYNKIHVNTVMPKTRTLLFMKKGQQGQNSIFHSNDDTHWRSSHLAVTHVRNKNSNIRGRPP